jgi:hypothetical protein
MVEKFYLLTTLIETFQALNKMNSFSNNKKQQNLNIQTFQFTLV